MTRAYLPSTFCAAVLLLITACAGSLFKVKPVVELPPMTGDVKSASAGGVTVRVAPLMTDEQSQELFEANLPLSGILPLRLEFVFESGVPVETKKVRFRLHDASGREWKLVTAKGAVARILKANDVYAYNPNARKQFEKEFTAYALDLKSALSASERQHQGFIFFEAPRNEPVENSRGLVLVIERLPQPIEDEVTVGHSVTLHGCYVEHGALIGIGSIVLDDARVGAQSLVATGSLISPGTVIPPRSLVMGVPARVKRPLTEEEVVGLNAFWQNYVNYIPHYQREPG